MSSSWARLVAVSVAFVLAGCGGETKQQAAAPPPPQVTVAKPVERTVTDYDEYVGRFVPIDSVEVRARVSGYLDQIHFKDGQQVKQGDLLFTIDKRPFQTALDQAKATLEQARANLAFAEADLSRAQQLVRDRTITEQTFDQRTQTKRVAQASVAAQEAAVRQATLDLEFTELRAPITGRIGDRRVSIGNLVTGGTGGSTTLLATIVTYDPIRFEFTFDEAAYLRYGRSAGDGPANRSGGLEVALKLIDEPDFTHVGRMDFVDNVIERLTGTIRGRAVLPNPNGLFTPGMFARVRVPASQPQTALLVPDVAIGSEQVRKFVFVVDGENVARQTFVTLGQLDGKLRVVKTGLKLDDRVIVNGMAKTRPGQKVTPKEEATQASAGPQASAGAPAAAKAD
ncbi:efflux RND transporter periplasmic adaptor subunit [Rhodoplanes roseus]|uniref:Efflux transporter periplasmic adaptor subunit n=1 Tax=Rhodoplanes roseus TaxID=29409 RepID=A0A327KZR6_9BRAD|nr:efflux RND transporter periplasmic adaptor subunit [Rhodoplanes roseus]RAI43676.1 efflux transporter periplasmic adaptor subunit [Rhodoplanes roseus]